MLMPQGFNKEIEDIFRVQKVYAIPDAELREALKKENKDFVLPFYETFLSKYGNVKFTTNTEKYVKHNVGSLSHLLDRFFDATS